MKIFSWMLDPKSDWWTVANVAGTWLAAVGTIAAVVVALGLARRDVKSRRVERKGEIIAMCADIYHAKHRLEALTNESIQAPLYRLPDSTFTLGLPKLIGDGCLTENEIAVLLKYTSKIAEINRGLDRAGDAHAAQPAGSDHLNLEFGRNQAKANEVIEPIEEGKEALINEAEAALYRMEKLYSTWWQRAKLNFRTWRN